LSLAVLLHLDLVGCEVRHEPSVAIERHHVDDDEVGGGPE
jgi:hypothetical protein